jgi:hypothetical protein
MVTLKVFNISRQEVATLVDENKKAGSYKFEFNGSNFSSGTHKGYLVISKIFFSLITGKN